MPQRASFDCDRGKQLDNALCDRYCRLSWRVIRCLRMPQPAVLDCDRGRQRLTRSLIKACSVRTLSLRLFHVRVVILIYIFTHFKRVTLGQPAKVGCKGLYCIIRNICQQFSIEGYNCNAVCLIRANNTAPFHVGLQHWLQIREHYDICVFPNSCVSFATKVLYNLEKAVTPLTIQPYVFSNYNWPEMVLLTWDWPMCCPEMVCLN